MYRPARAQAFYPGDLDEQVAGWLDGWSIPTSIPQQLSGGIMPHAGWAYSGRLATRTLHTLVVRALPRTVVFLASVHVPDVTKASVYPEGSWETPVGTVEVDAELANRLLEALPEDLVAAPEAHENDHAIEVQLPILRLLAPGCKCVPIATPVASAGVRIGKTLGQLLAQDPDIQVVSSSDLTHYGTHYGFTPAGVGASAQAWMRDNDQRMIELVLEGQADAIAAEAAAQQNACGPAGLAAALACARERGAGKGHLIEYTTSHAEHGQPPFTMAVGYLAAVFG